MKLHNILWLTGLCGVAASAAPINYTINFTGGSVPVTSGSFKYDSSTVPGSRFSEFTVLWAGYIFDLTASANGPNIGISGGACSDDAFILLSSLSGACTTHTSGAVPYPRWEAVGAGTPSTSFSFADIADRFADSLIVNAVVSNGPSVTQPGSAGSWSISVASTEIPEPGSILLTATGGAVLLAGKRRAARKLG